MKPPMKNGVSPSRLYLEKLACPPATLFEFLCQKFPQISPETWRQRFENQDVLSETHTPFALHSPYEQGKTIYYYKAVKGEIKVPFDYQILFENQEFILVDKPHFLTVSPAGDHVQETLLTRLKTATGNDALSPIHRLDKETAGLILISKNPDTRGLYQSLFARHAITKVYHAIARTAASPLPQAVSLHLERGEPFYTMRVNPDKPANTHTLIKELSRQGGWAKYELTPTTGKLHQLRVHLSYLGIPIKNDPFYPTVRHKDKGDFSAPLQLLAKSLAFTDPITDKRYDFCSALTLEF